MILVRNLLDGAAAHMVVGEHQAVLANEGTRAAGEAHHGKTHMIQPLLIRREAVSGLHLFRRHVVEGPHAFVGAKRADRKHDGQSAEPQEAGGGFREFHEGLLCECIKLRGLSFKLSANPLIIPGRVKKDP